MPQLQLPIFPAETKLINNEVGVECKEGKVVYWHGHLPLFRIFSIKSGTATYGHPMMG